MEPKFSKNHTETGTDKFIRTQQRFELNAKISYLYSYILLIIIRERI